MRDVKCACSDDCACATATKNAVTTLLTTCSQDAAQSCSSLSISIGNSLFVFTRVFSCECSQAVANQCLKLDLECMLGHVTGVQIENKNALINPPC